MGENLYVQESLPAGTGARRILSVLMTLLLMLSIGFGVYVKVSRDSAYDALDAFHSAMADENYDMALVTLRDLQSSVAAAEAAGNEGPNDLLYRDTLAEMEKTVTDRVASVFSAVSGRLEPLSETDRQFLEGMEEMTGMLVSARLWDQCTELLLGESSRAGVAGMFGVFGVLDNLSQPVSGLAYELETIEAASPKVQIAEQALTDTLYFNALEQFETIAGKSEGFVQEYALTRIQACKDAMMEPLTEMARQWLDAGRNYSARDLLMRLRGIFPHNVAIESHYQNAVRLTEQTLEPFGGNVEHVVVRPLVVEDSRAFDGDGMQYAISQAMITTDEFKALLDGLYERDYILVDIGRMLDEDGVPAILRLPAGKKPLVLTLDTVNYYPHRAINGLCSTLVVDENGHVSGKYLDVDGVMRVDRQAEAIGILDAFVDNHPDFTFDGAKGIVSLTGYEGIFGYVTNERQLQRFNDSRVELGLPITPMTDAEFKDNAENATRVANALVRTGWRIASSTYGFIEPGNGGTSLEALESDTLQWLEEVGSLVGGSDIYTYPNGSFLNGDDPKCLMLRENGFRFFSGIGPVAYSFYRENYIYMDKVAINGYSIEHDSGSRFFDIVASRDPARPS